MRERDWPETPEAGEREAQEGGLTREALQEKETEVEPETATEVERGAAAVVEETMETLALERVMEGAKREEREAEGLPTKA
ncbi:MAG: hypothetical protein AB9888_13280 [Bacteroidales bacterium]